MGLEQLVLVDAEEVVMDRLQKGCLLASAKRWCVGAVLATDVRRGGP